MCDELEEYDCEMCEDTGCEECDPENHEWHSLKWIAESCTTLDEVVAAAKQQYEHLKDRLDNGWQLEQPVDNGYVFLKR